MKVKSLMVQGTASDSGKSTLVTALARHYTNQGYKVFPFKSQNMASNSAYTIDGKEISRAQLSQAEAAKRQAETRMNPIFLKPSSDTGSEVILNGEPYKHMSAREYGDFKGKLKSFLAKTYGDIEKENDLILLEGAGSPAEINLQENDIVNMGMADIADCPVILVADIDLGGVFASIYGTIELQEPAHKDRIRGIIINKFRGDVSILKSGLDMIEDLTGVPVIGVVPYLDIRLEEEDSVSIAKMPSYKDQTKDIDIGILALSKIANFSEFESLKVQEDLSLRFIRDPGEFQDPDIIIVPDSTSPRHALAWIREKDLDRYINLHNKNKKPILAFGSGLYLLGNTIEDEEGSYQGLSLLNIDTKMMLNREISQVDLGLYGYDLSLTMNKKAHIDIKDTSLIGILEDLLIIDGENNIIGAQALGFFENVNFIRHMLNDLRKTKGLGPLSPPKMTYKEYKDRQYDKLAEETVKHIDMDRLDEIIFG